MLFELEPETLVLLRGTGLDIFLQQTNQSMIKFNYRDKLILEHGDVSCVEFVTRVLCPLTFFQSQRKCGNALKFRGLSCLQYQSAVTGTHCKICISAYSQGVRVPVPVSETSQTEETQWQKPRASHYYL